MILNKDMLRIDKIEELINESGMTKSHFYRQVDITKTGFQEMKKRGDVKASFLVKVCLLFKVSIEYFFDGKEIMPDKGNKFDLKTRFYDKVSSKIDNINEPSEEYKKEELALIKLKPEQKSVKNLLNWILKNCVFF